MFNPASVARCSFYLLCIELLVYWLALRVALHPIHFQFSSTKWLCNIYCIGFMGNGHVQTSRNRICKAKLLTLQTHLEYWRQKKERYNEFCFLWHCWHEVFSLILYISMMHQMNAVSMVSLLWQDHSDKVKSNF